MKYLKIFLFGIAVFLISLSYTYAGRRMDGIGNDLEGVIVDLEGNGLDVNRNPANLTFLDKTKLYIDFAGYGTVSPSPYILNFVTSPVNNIFTLVSLTYGNQVTRDTWQLTAPPTALTIGGALGNDSSTTIIETGSTTTLNDDWTKITSYSGLQEVTSVQGGRFNIGAGVGIKIDNNLCVGGKIAIENNDDGHTKNNATYSYNVIEVVPTNVKAAANESFNGVRTLSQDIKISTAPTSFAITGGVNFKPMSGLSLDVASNIRIKTGEVSNIGTATETIDKDPDGDNTVSNQDWINLNSYLVAGGKSGTKTISQNYKGDLSGVDMGVNAVGRFELSNDITLAVPVSYSLTPYKYSQNRNTITTILATGVSTIGGGVNNVYNQSNSTTDIYSVDYSQSVLSGGIGVNVKKFGADIGVGLRLSINNSETTIIDGADNVSRLETNTNNALTGYTTRTTTIQNDTSEVTTVTKTDGITIALPVGFEIPVVKGLVARAGLEQVWTMSRTGTTTTTKTNPKITTTITDGNSNVVAETRTTTIETTNLPEKRDSTMTTLYTLGLGFMVSDVLTIELVTNGNIFNINNIMASATFIF